MGYKRSNDWAIQSFLIKKEQSTINNLSQPRPDGRGRRSSEKKIDTKFIEEHIESFHPTISHYRREHAPNRRYLPSDINATFMHKDFLEKYPQNMCSYEVYRKVIKQKNISFAQLGHEECELCEEFKLHNPQHKSETLEPDCEECKKWNTHILRAKRSRELYQQDCNKPQTNDTIKVSVDLQKIIMIPRIEMFKKAIFTQRLIAYNESFVPLGKCKQSPPYAVLWHEAVSGRSKENIISCFYSFFLHNRDYKTFVIWLDNCAAQNKNWAFFTFLIFLINSEQTSAQKIIINYFETGHTFMSADSFHHQVELSLKRQKKNLRFPGFCKSG